jgi:glyoxylase-like metal-dependent hydrolase (beta-lactamase superfamily II)
MPCFLPRPPGNRCSSIRGMAAPGAVRDAGRIMAAVRDAGVQRIDHLIITHYHGDHIGGLSELATHIPIKEFIDHGANTQPGPNIDPVLTAVCGTLCQSETHGGKTWR